MPLAPMTPPAVDSTPIEVSEVLSQFAELTVYAIALSSVIFTALGFKYGFRTVWGAVKSALGIGSKAVKTG